VVVRQDAQLFCVLEIGIPKKSEQAVLDKLNDLRGLEPEKI